MLGVNQDFLDKLFSLLDIPEKDGNKFREDLIGVISNNVAASFINDLPANKKGSFVNLVKSGAISQEFIQKWAEQENIAGDKQLVENINKVVGESIEQFFSALTQDLMPDIKTQVAAFAKGYLNG